ncbi:MAG: aspartyl protease family protein [Gammaproteobacteria bacterium]|jgi:aspartyl protease family protein
MTTPQQQEPRSNQRRIGGMMIAMCWIVVIGLVAVLFSGLLGARHNPNSRVTSSMSNDAGVQVHLRQNAMGHYVATGTLNGAATVFLLDTGATTISVPAKLADALKLTRGAAQQSQTANGAVTVYRTRIDEVSLGGIVMHNVSASINPGMDGNEVLLGMSFLRHLDLLQREGTLTLTHSQRSN